MPRISRPSAYDISFPDENNAQHTPQAGPSQQKVPSTPIAATAPVFHAAKRTLDDVGKASSLTGLERSRLLNGRGPIKSSGNTNFISTTLPRT